MKLQSDPTIVYGLVGGKGTLGRGILRSEIETATPYNTYVIEGLPPGPIANPGRAALEAVANPSRTKDLYFVADGSGGHVFAETYDQHQRNVARWRQIEKASTASRKPVDPVDRGRPPPGTPRDSRIAPSASPAPDSAGPSGARRGLALGARFDASEGTDKDPLLEQVLRPAIRPKRSAAEAALAAFRAHGRMALNGVASPAERRLAESSCALGAHGALWSRRHFCRSEVLAMAIASMTGFAREAGRHGPVSNGPGRSRP